MIRKTYAVNAIEWDTVFNVNGKPVRILFKNGSFGGNMIPARFSTTDKILQNAIEGDARFNKTIRLEALSEIKPLKEVVQEKSEVKAFSGITSIQDARNVLSQEPYNVPLDELKNKTAIKKAAKEKGVSFPNLA